MQLQFWCFRGAKSSTIREFVINQVTHQQFFSIFVVKEFSNLDFYQFWNKMVNLAISA